MDPITLLVGKQDSRLEGQPLSNYIITLINY